MQLPILLSPDGLALCWMICHPICEERPIRRFRRSSVSYSFSALSFHCDQPSITPNAFNIAFANGRAYVHSGSKARPQKYLLTFSSVILLARSDKPLLRSISASTRSLGLSENFPLHKAFISAVT